MNTGLRTLAAPHKMQATPITTLNENNVLRNDYGAIESTKIGLDELPPLELPSAGSYTSLMITVSTSTSTSTESMSKLRRLFRSKLTYLLLACLALVLLVVLLCYVHVVRGMTIPPLRVTQNTIAAASRVVNCGADTDMACDDKFGCVTYEQDLESVLTDIQLRWNVFADFVFSSTGYELDADACFGQKIVRKQLVCSDVCSNVAYVSNDDGDHDAVPNVCKNTFLDEMNNVLQPYRRACIAALVAHEFSSMCGRKDKVSNSIQMAVFTWYAETFGVEHSEWKRSDCPAFFTDESFVPSNL